MFTDRFLSSTFVANGRATGITTSAVRSCYYCLKEKMIKEAGNAAAGEDEAEPTQGDEVDCEESSEEVEFVLK
jgi:hypothetical protein